MRPYFFMIKSTFLGYNNLGVVSNEGIAMRTRDQLMLLLGILWGGALTSCIFIWANQMVKDMILVPFILLSCVGGFFTLIFMILFVDNLIRESK